MRSSRAATTTGPMAVVPALAEACVELGFASSVLHRLKGC